MGIVIHLSHSGRRTVTGADNLGGEANENKCSTFSCPWWGGGGGSD